MLPLLLLACSTEDHVMDSSETITSADFDKLQKDLQVSGTTLRHDPTRSSFISITIQ